MESILSERSDYIVLAICLSQKQNYIPIFEVYESSSSSFLDLEEDLSTFQLSKRHWRLRGFQIGRCPVSADSQLKVSVTFPDTFMLQRFIHGLLEAGYSECELTIRKLTISFLFPSVNESPNYHTRSSQFKENAVKWQNAFHCHLYSFLTHPFDNTTDKLIYLHTSHPSMFRYLCRIRS